MTRRIRDWVWIGLLAVSCAPARASEAPASAPAEGGGEAAQPSQAPEAAAPTAPTDAATTEYRTLAEAEGALEKAKAELEQLAFAQPPPPSAPGAAPSKKEAADRAADELGEQQKADSGCSNACRAFASLLRAANAVCRLDAEGGDRCARAKLVVTDAERRVSSCGCPR